MTRTEQLVLVGCTVACLVGTVATFLLRRIDRAVALPAVTR